MTGLRRHRYFVQASSIVRAVVSVVERFYELPSARGVMSRNRTPAVANARALAMYVSRGATSLSYPELGRLFRRDHSTVVAAVQRVESWMDKDPFVKYQLIQIAQLVALRTQQPHLAAPKQELPDPSTVTPEIAQQLTDGACRPDVLLGAAEAPVDRAEPPLQIGPSRTA